MTSLEDEQELKDRIVALIDEFVAEDEDRVVTLPNISGLLLSLAVAYAIDNIHGADQ